jgi:hypothetical protein
MKAFASILLVAFGSSLAVAQQQAQPAAGEQSAQPIAVPEQQPQPAPQPPPQSPPPQHIALRIVGSQVLNKGGDRLGRIEELLVNRASGAVDYAVVAPHFPTNSARLVPIPWSALTYAWDQSRAGGPAGANQVFIANVDARRLAQAPSIDRARPSATDETLANANNFFGVPQAAGATGTPSTGVTGTGAAPAVDQSSTVPTTGGIIGQPIDNSLTVPGQRSTIQPSQPIGGGGNQIGVGEQPEQRVPHINGSTTRSGQSGNAPAQGASPSGTRAGGSSTGGSGGASGGGSAGK